MFFGASRAILAHLETPKDSLRDGFTQICGTCISPRPLKPECVLRQIVTHECDPAGRLRGLVFPPPDCPKIKNRKSVIMTSSSSHTHQGGESVAAAEPDYRHTLALPRTDFAMRAGLPKREPTLLERWGRLAVYDQLRERAGSAAGTDSERKPFILHDGPPYANGHLPHRSWPEQDPQGHDRSIAADDGQGQPLRPGLGLPRLADRVEDRGAVSIERSRTPGRADRRNAGRVPQVRREVDRCPAGRVFNASA